EFSNRRKAFSCICGFYCKMYHLPFLDVSSFISLFSCLYLFHHLTGRTRNHGHYVCSTWGNNHFKTFDGDIYQFPGICEYNFASDCRESYKEFSVHIQRALNSNNHPEIQYILITIKDFTMYLRPKVAVVDGRIVKTPYYSSGVLIESDDIYTKVYAKLGLTLIWNQEDALMVELDNKFNNHTCGLCGDYNGVPIYNEFINGFASYNSITYGNLQKISKPNAKCEDPDETQALPNCNGHRDECERLLTSSAFADCWLRLNSEIYIQACMQDKCACNGNEDSFCLCSTISEYSRQCSHAGGRPGEWRTQYFCPKSCPDTMIYRESSSPCMDTCSHLAISSLCEEHYMDGCFCPEGTVYDDVTEKGCIPVSQCHCKLHGKEYSPGESITNECEECTCNSGRWTCKDLPCPGTCSVEGGSHITTFDGKKYTFHGDCYYVLAKGTVNDSHALLAELAPCGSTDRQTCLKTVVLLVDHKKNVVVFRSDGSVLLNEMTVNVPHVSASFSVFKPSSHYLIVQTSFGLQLQIQLFPVMQLFATVDQTVQGKLQGLCGNFNGMEGDDFKTTSGLVEATGSAFANTWKAQSTCTDQAEKLEDPCSLSIESANYAEHWCSLLKNPEGPFARCHLIIDPSEYYKKCKYDTCLCEDNEECLCAALSSYSRACAFKGVILGGWRKSICTNEVSACPGNQIFLYNLTMCQQTCRSLADGEKHCLQDFAPVDGCGCPYNTYLDNQDTCVPISKCPCYYKGSYLEPGEYIRKDGERWYVLLWLLVCGNKNTTECSSDKRYFDCNTSPTWTSQTPVQLSCHTPRTDHVCIQFFPIFPNSSLLMRPENKILLLSSSVCQKGSWSCTEYVCYGTCTIYGSGHYITFDGKFYDFDGRCEYVATQDFCGDRNSSGSFSIITENVPCGTTGVTCSKAIKIFLGKTELKLEDKDYKEIQRDIGDDVRYWNTTVGLYLVIEASNGVMLIWDKKTTVFIKLTPDYKGKVCGLCGNFDDKSNNDFTTRSGVQETNALKFGNSWKQSSTCPDVTEEIKPCDVKPHRESWAKKECNIIRSDVFKICHSKVDPNPFYDACVHDACSCDSGGDCECFCSAVAAYAQECTKAQACVFWRTPDICPIFCDYYNPRNECDWHYEPCGSNVTTCRMINNVSTNFTVPYLEGCYPRCPPDKPYYNEETKECVPEDLCWCYVNGIHVPPGGEIPTEDNCTKCYEVGEVVAQIQDGNICIIYICAENGSVVVGSTFPCPTSTSPTTTSTAFPTSTLTTTGNSSTEISDAESLSFLSAPCFGLICNWTEWFDVSKPEEDGGDYETYDAIRNEHGDKICEAPEKIECRAKEKPDVSLEELGQKVECNVTYGLICKNEDQDPTMWQLCYNYEIRVNCCEWYEIPCETTPTPTPTSTTTSTTVVITTTTRRPTASTTTPIPTPTITSGFTPSVTTPVTSTSPAPSSSTTTTVSSPPVSTTTPTPTPSELPIRTTSTTMPPSSTTSSTIGTTTTGTVTTTRTPTTPSMFPTPVIITKTPLPPTSKHPYVQWTPRAPPASVLVPRLVVSLLSVSNCSSCCCPPDCDCIWTDWIDVSYPNSSDRNSGDYETFENILKHNSSWVCAKAENISCRAEQFPDVSIEDLGQKVECNVNTGLICNNSDQVIGGIVPMPVCLNYEISLCCVPDIPECIPSTTPSTTTAPPSSTMSTTTTTVTPSSTPFPTTTTTGTSTVSMISTTIQQSTPPGSTTPVPVTTTGVTETGSTTKTTPSTPTPSPPTPHSTTTVTQTSTEQTTTTGTGSPPTGPPTATISTTTSAPSSPGSTASTTLPPPTASTPPVSVTTTGVTETGSTTKTTPSTPTPSPPTPHSTTTVTQTSTEQTTTTGTGSPPTGPPTATISTTTSAPSSPGSTASTTLPPPTASTPPVSVTTTGVTETGSTTKTTPSTPTPSPPTPHSTTTVTQTSTEQTTTTGTGSPPTGPPTATISTTTSAPSSPGSTASTTLPPPTASTPPVSVTTTGVTETGSTTKTTPSTPTPSPPTPHSTTTVTQTSTEQTTTTGTGSPPTGPPTATISTTTSAPSSPGSTASTTLPPPTASTPPVSVTTTGVTETGSTTKTTPSTPTPSPPTPHSTTTVTQTSTEQTTTTGTGSPPTGPPTATISTTTSAPSSPGSTASTTLPPPTASTPPVSVTTTGVTETGSTTKTTPSTPTPSPPTPHSTTTVTQTSTEQTTTTGTGSPPTGPPTATISTTTSAPSSPGSTASTTLPPPTASTPPVSVTTTGVTETGSTTKTTPSTPTPSPPTPHSTTTVTQTSAEQTTTTGTGSPPTGPPTATISTTTSAPSSPGSTASTTLPPPTASTPPVSVTTSGTTPTQSFTTTSGTTSVSITTVTATTTTSEITSPVSTTTSRPTATSSAVTVVGSSTYSTVTPPGSTTSPPSSTPGRNCSILPNESYVCLSLPPPFSFQTQPGESWWLCDCFKAICIEDNIIQVVPIVCNPPPKPTCANGLSPVQVIDEDGCCWHWECDCYCTGWGDPHYMTFDGLYYSYQGNCTYVLVEEINKKVDNFGVYIDNYHCDARDVVSCPRTLIVRHETQEVRMATVKPNTLQVTVNKQAVALPYKKFGLTIYESGINRVVEIPELKMNVTYNGLSFSIRMPYSLFGNNTHGQCGTCNNNTADDCMLPNGNIAENCQTMADHWQVVDPSKPQCSPGLTPTKAPITTPVKPCKESFICELLLGSVFEPCHGFVEPEKYYAACVFDSCVLPNLDLECSSLQIYAATCADQSVCIDWRSHTNGVCCKYSAVYLELLGNQQNETSTKQVEGCFCPNGTMLYDSGVDVCVKTCGEYYWFIWMHFTIDCQDCICLEGGSGIVCEPHVCVKQNKTSCDGEGFYEVNEVNSEDFCCPIVTCKCNTSLCTTKAPKCTLGFEVHSHIPSGHCCPVYECVPKRVCVHQNAEFLPNSSVFVDKCQNCFCTNEVNVSTQLNIISCEHIPCNTYCEPGYEHQPVKGECCGRCVQTKCVIRTPNNSHLILSVSMLYILHLYQICKVAPFREGTSPCQIDVVIFHVNRYSAEANSMDHRCSCCRESKTTVKKVNLKCPNGHSISHKYIYVESCSCQDTTCSTSHSRESQSREENDKASALNRIKRAISLTSQ
uniref:Mucin 2, oligomeric mucus/gel-forming n=1 Tax=Strix occidentalis caurina TaxID=311401 RepID=A0A8D0EWD7_STROC